MLVASAVAGAWYASARFFAAHLGERHAPAAELLGHRHEQVARLPQVFEVFGEELVLAVVAGRPLGTSLRSRRKERT